MRHSGTRKLFDYWNLKRQGRPAPARADIAPAGIASLLASTFLIDIDAGQPAFRLAGTRLCAAFGRELAGESFAAAFSRDDRPLAGRIALAVHREHVIAVIDIEAIAVDGRSLNIEAILLPLEGEAPGIIGAVHFIDAPYWLGLRPIGELRLSAVRFMDPERELFSLNNRPSVPIPHMRSLAGRLRPNLRLIDGEAAKTGTGTARRPPRLDVLRGGRADPRD